MKFNGEKEYDRDVQKNRASYLSGISVFMPRLVSASVVHGDIIKTVNEEDKGMIFPSTDGLFTNNKNVFLSLTVADCLPIYIFDPKGNVIGIVHGGWRSLSKNIITKALKKAQKELGLNPFSTIVGIGPGICARHFEVKKDVVGKFKKYPKSIIQRNKKMYVDLKSIAIKQLSELGIKEKNIEVNSVCISEDDNYFSYRRDKPKYVEAMMAIAGLKD